MGTAPPSGRHPAMPAPRRLVRRSIVAAQSKGWSKAEAAATVLWVIERCQRWLDLDGSDLTGWFAELHAEAMVHARVPMSPVTTRSESDHGDKSTQAGRGTAGASEEGT